MTFVQDNHSRSVRHTLRGLHWQVGPIAQAKLIRVLAGEIFDVAVDIRTRVRRRSAAGSARACRPRASDSSTSRSASRTASASSATSRTWSTSARRPTTRPPSAGSPGTIRTSASSGRPERRSSRHETGRISVCEICGGAEAQPSCGSRCIALRRARLQPRRRRPSLRHRPSGAQQFHQRIDAGVH